MTIICPIQPRRLSACNLVQRILPLYDRPLWHRERVMRALQTARQCAMGNIEFRAAEATRSVLLTELNYIRESESKVIDSYFSVVAETRHRVLRNIVTAVVWCLSHPQDTELVFVEASRCAAFAVADAARADVLYRELQLAQSVALGEIAVPEGLPISHTQNSPDDITGVVLSVSPAPITRSLSQIAVPVPPPTSVQQKVSSSSTRLSRLLRQPPSVRNTQDVISHIAQLFPTTPIAAPTAAPTLPQPPIRTGETGEAISNVT